MSTIKTKTDKAVSLTVAAKDQALAGSTLRTVATAWGAAGSNYAGVRRTILAAFQRHGVDPAAGMDKVSPENKTTIMLGLLDHYAASEPTRFYRPGDNGTLFLVMDPEAQKADGLLLLTADQARNGDLKAIKKSDPLIARELQAYRGSLTNRATARYAAIFRDAKAQAREDVTRDMFSANPETRAAAEAAKKADTRETLTDLQTISEAIERVYAMIDKKLDKKEPQFTKEQGLAIKTKLNAAQIACKPII
jgi:hypothetical protein